MKIGMLQVRENEISLRRWSGGSGGTAQLRTSEGTLLVVTDFCSRGFYQTIADLVTLSRSHLRSTPQAPFHLLPILLNLRIS